MQSIGMLSVDDQMSIEGSLKDYLEKSEARWAALVDRGGNLFAEFGDTGALDINTLCALAAGSFAATHELAKRLGENEFTALYQEGEGVSILMSSLVYDCLLLTVFDKRTNIGLVRFYAQQTTEALNGDLKSAQERSDQAAPLQVDAELDSGSSIIS